MDRSLLLARLREMKPWLESKGISRVRIFGSHALDSARADSDVDLVVEFLPGYTPDLFAFSGLKLDLEERLGARVDLLTPSAMHPALKERIEATLIDAWQGLADPRSGHDRAFALCPAPRGGYG